MRSQPLAVLILACAACGDATPKPPVHAPVAAPVAAGPDLRDPFALMPADSDVVLRIDVAAMRRSPLWSKYKSQAIAMVAPSFAACGYDPFDEITTITAGIPIEGALGVFVIRDLDRDKLLHCLHTPTGDTDNTVTIDGDYITLTNKSGSVNMLTFVDAHNAVMQGSKHPTKETLQQALQIGAPLRKDADFVAVDQQLAPNAALSFVSRPGSQVFAKMMAEKLGAPARYLAATVHLTDRLEAHIAFALASADAAAALAAQMQPKATAMKAYVERFDERAQGDTVMVDAAVTETQLKALVGMLKAAMGGS